MEKQQDPRFLFSPASAQTLRERAQLAVRRYGFAIVVFLSVAFLGGLVSFLTRASFQTPDVSSPSSLAAGAPIASLGITPPDSASPDPFEGTATLSITSHPSGADTFIDGVLIGTTPVEAHTVSAGVYYVTLRKAGYFSRDTVAVIRAATLPDLAFTLKARLTSSEALLAESPPLSGALSRRQTAREPSLSKARPEPAAGRRSSTDASEEAATAEAPATPADEAVSARAPSQAERYEEHLARGNELFIQEHYLQARREYELALEAQPGDGKAAARVAKIDTLLAQARRAEELYNYHRGRGDVFLEKEDFEAATANYRSALEYRPGDAHLRERMAAAMRALEQRSRKAAMKDGVVLGVDEQPKLIGGLIELHRQVRYPREAQRRGIEGRVVASVIVDEEGRVQSSRILEGIGGGCDEEALRVIKKARFEPAMLDGKPVKAQQAVWIRFNLEDGNMP